MTKQNFEPFYHYWSKAREEGVHLFPYHALDAAAVGRLLVEALPRWSQTLAQLSGLSLERLPDWISFLFSIHDLGKLSSHCFQNKVPDAYLRLTSKPPPPAPGFVPRHDFLGWYLWNEIPFPNRQKGLVEAWLAPMADAKKADLEDLISLMNPWVLPIFGHHGLPPREANTADSSLWQTRDRDVALAFVQAMAQRFLPDGLPFDSDALHFDDNLDRFKHASWLLAGGMVMADWLGSNSRWFSPTDQPMALDHYWHGIALPNAKTALEQSGLIPAISRPAQGLVGLYPGLTTPSPMQQAVEALSLTDAPLLAILEDVTGGGKTEAAIVLAQRIMAQGRADGIYFALPTMTTANAIHARVQPIVHKFYEQDGPKPVILLTHGKSHLYEEKLTKAAPPPGEEESQAQANLWLRDSRKKGLLAHVGVGTLDQALMGILPLKHQSLRLLGLANKVLIVDEVHACDQYLLELLQRLLAFHAAHGGSAILLSATLPRGMRAELIEAFARGRSLAEGRDQNRPDSPPQNTSYPLLTTSLGGALIEEPVACQERLHHRVECVSLDTEAAVFDHLTHAAEAGGCACWIRNSVDDAREAYSALRQRLGGDRVHLFHARFALADRMDIEQRILTRFGKDSTLDNRRGQVVVATQVVEQSLDIDFDAMVSDLAPADLLIQRAGRLQRHERGVRPGGLVKRLGVLMPSLEEPVDEGWYARLFPRGAYVYPHHGRLYLTAWWLSKNGGFSIPGDARDWIESVYGEASQAHIPEALIAAQIKAEGADMSAKSLAKLNAISFKTGYQSGNGWRDDAHPPTRLGEPTLPLYLARQVGLEVRPWREEGSYPWDLSALSVRRGRVAEEARDATTPLLKWAREAIGKAADHGVVVVLKEIEKGRWQGSAHNEQGRVVTITYDPELGLGFEA
ncbi:MAG: CRISPR-associated helicase Cas3' [Magnetococcales bacterium]|nr:CRISPR-associated helicase Cas3' [Magnetococcales bacterium]